MPNSEDSKPIPSFPPLDLPVLFADGVLNASRNPHVVRYYLGREDPSLPGASGYAMRPVAQVVMPVPSFVQTVIFFNRMLQDLVDGGIIKQEMIDYIKSFDEKDQEV